MKTPKLLLIAVALFGLHANAARQPVRSASAAAKPPGTCQFANPDNLGKIARSSSMRVADSVLTEKQGSSNRGNSGQAGAVREL